ncbi:SusC/RagA family TonB-linked outer membrane protein [Sphingobacterium spiritivorum]|uniref:SusC/RagA family TonB-linked outer membrane protein n=1 Tax=Sphingobacterium spiritivorum TaxID=258 RepID=UPI003DA469D8
MRLTLLLTIVFSLQVSASTLAQQISLDVKNKPLSGVLRELRKQSGYAFIYNDNDLREAQPVTIKLQSKNILEALELIFKNQPLEYLVNDKVINIRPKSSSSGTPARKEEIKQQLIKGRVTDQDGKPLAGATIKVKGTNIVSMTDKAGEFTLPATDLNSTIEITFLGYETKELTYTGSKNLIIVLNNSLSTIQEIEVNAGYWKVNEKLRTGNISKVDGETIRQQPVSDPMLALAGRVPGLVVSQFSGLPGASNSIRLRGTNSIANGNDPLILIDGIPFSSQSLTNSVIGGGATPLSPFALINGEEIESIEVLKDADATAIYGSRGANGVILITTKKGKSGKSQFNLNAYTGYGKVAKMLDMLNTDQYLEMRREAFANDGITTYPESEYDVNGTWDQNRYTDWQKVMIGNTASMSNIQAQISGGSAATQFTFGVGTLKESTVFPGDYKTKNHSANFSLNHSSDNKKFEMSLSARYLGSISDQPLTDFAKNDIRLAPNAPALYHEDGKLNWENETWNNPFAQLNANANAKSRNLVANVALNYSIINDLHLKLNLGYNEQQMDQSIMTPITAFLPSLSSISALRSHRRAENERKGWIIEPQINYNRQINTGKLTLTIGGTLQENNSYALAQNASDFTDDTLIENIMAAANIITEQNVYTQYRYIAFFARANYNWRDKYILNLVGRRDGSTRFAPGRRYGNFASVGGAWIFSNEELFKNEILSFGKIRASYGVTGNDQLQDYQYLSTFSSYAFPYLGTTGLYPTRFYTPDYGWESVRKIEGALDLGFFADRIKLSTVFYRNRTDNQLVGYPLPTMTGFPSVMGNLPAVVENKGWEFELNTVNIKNDKFTWSSALNLSLPKNKLIDYPDLEKSSYRNRYEIGKPLSIQRLWHYTGVDRQTGLHTFEDVNGDGNISSPQDLQSLVDTAPKFFGGFSNTLSYKGISLDIFFQFVKKKGRLPYVGVPGAFVNQPTWVMNRWQQSNDVTDVQRYTQGGTALTTMVNAINSSDMAYGDASFIRLKNLSLSYQLPTKIARAAWLQQCRIYMQGQNLFTITDYPGYDPETVNVLPAIRMFTAGLNFTL